MLLAQRCSTSAVTGKNKTAGLTVSRPSERQMNSCSPTRLQAVAKCKDAIQGLLGPPEQVTVAALGGDDTLQRWGDVFSTIQVGLGRVSGAVGVAVEVAHRRCATMRSTACCSP